MDLRLRAQSAGERLSVIHARIREVLPSIDSIGVAYYDPKTDTLRSLVHKNESPVARQEALLSRMPSLLALAESGEVMGLTDLPFLDAPKRDTQRVADHTSRTSLTKPLFSGGHLSGFLFFSSAAPGFFDASGARPLEVFTDLLLLAFFTGPEPLRRLRSAVHLALQLARFRDAETGMHPDRVSRYAHLIAQALPPEEGLHPEAIDHLVVFTRAHDIGKVAVPDNVLLKEGVLTPAEVEVVKGHVTSGVAVVEGLIRDLDLGGLPYVSMLRSVVRSHHEALDGSGYPDGLTAAEIPLAVRIVTVADVFDALTSVRPYKKTWSLKEALGYLVERKGTRFDAACVTAFEGCAVEVESIRQQYDAAVL